MRNQVIPLTIIQKLVRMPNTANELQMKTNCSLHIYVQLELWSPVDRRSFTSPCACGVARMEPDSEVPCFEKKMTHSMLQKNQRVLIPGSFIRTHGHMLDTVISLTGPNRQMCTVAISTYPPIRGRGQTEFRFFLGSGWKEFVKENRFEVSDCILFMLVGNSCFHVRLASSKLQEKAVVKTTPLSKRCNECGLRKSEREDDGVIPQSKVLRLYPKVKFTEQATTVPKREPNCNLRETSIRPWRGIPEDNVMAVIRHPRLPETDYVKHPGLHAAISSNSRFPQFISKLSRISLYSHDIRLEIPYRFAKEYGHKFQERVCLLGPSGQWRIVKVRVSSTFRSNVRVQFRHGWKAFSVENGFTEGDVLLFSLVKFSKFLVQVFPVAATQ